MPSTRGGSSLVGSGGPSSRCSQTYCSIQLPSGDTRASFGGGSNSGGAPGGNQPTTQLLVGVSGGLEVGGGGGAGGPVGLGAGGPATFRDRKESIMSSAATMRVLSVLRHWISKHRDDFESSTSGDLRLKNLTIEFLEDVLSSPQLLPAEHKAASQLLQLLTREDPSYTKIDLNVILAQPPVLFFVSILFLFVWCTNNLIFLSI